MSASFFLILAAVTPLAVRGIAPGQSTRADVLKAFGNPVKADCRRECEFNPQLDSKKIVVRFSGDTAKEVDVTLDRWVRRSVLEEAWKLPAPDSAGKRGGVWREVYQGKGIVLTFRGGGPESGVKGIRYASPGSLAVEKWLGLAGRSLLILGLTGAAGAALVLTMKKRRAKEAASRPTCPACGHPPRKRNRFCTRCGTKLGVAE
ncbi:MAG: hypothetical protein DIJKHBIC_01220 [Thermoanaerobaculia bacterium]|nr:hypothetical protein [Thermoanaerobaculia bacterium]